MNKEALQTRVLDDPKISIYPCGRKDIAGGLIDRRVLATLLYLRLSGLDPTVTSLHCGHSFLTTSGNVSEHSSGTAVDIAKVNGIPIVGHQGKGSITDITIRRLLLLQGNMKPHQIISLMTYKGADNTLSLPDHYDHIHVGFRPLYGPNAKLGKQLAAILKPGPVDQARRPPQRDPEPDRLRHAVEVRAEGQGAPRARRRLAPPRVPAPSPSSSWTCRACSGRATAATSCASTPTARPPTSSCSRPSAPRSPGAAVAPPAPQGARARLGARARRGAGHTGERRVRRVGHRRASR